MHKTKIVTPTASNSCQYSNKSRFRLWFFFFFFFGGGGGGGGIRVPFVHGCITSGYEVIHALHNLHFIHIAHCLVKCFVSVCPDCGFIKSRSKGTTQINILSCTLSQCLHERSLLPINTTKNYRFDNENSTLN